MSVESCVVGWSHFTICLVSSYAKSVGAKHLLSSAKLNKGVDELFLELAKGKLLPGVIIKIVLWMFIQFHIISSGNVVFEVKYLYDLAYN